MLNANTIREVGLDCFPCDPVRKVPLVQRGQDWRQAAKQPLDRLAPSTVWGVPVPEGVVVIDLDLYKGVTRQSVEAITGPLDWDNALIQRTQKGGEHYAFRAPQWPVRQTDSNSGVDGFDTRVGGKGYIATGAGYEMRGLFGPLVMANPDLLPALPDTARASLEMATHQSSTGAKGPHTASLEQIRDALRYVSPHCVRSKWVKIGLALKSFDPDNGFEVFDEWSRGDIGDQGVPDSYHEASQFRQWQSFKVEGGTTIASLFYEAFAGGWPIPKSFDVSNVFGSADNTETIDDILAHGSDPKQTKRLADLVGSDPLLSAVLMRELKESGLLTPRLKKALEPSQFFDKGAKPDLGGVLPTSTPMHHSLWEPGHTKGKYQKPIGTYENFLRMLDAYGIQIQSDVIKKNISITGPTIRPDESENSRLALLDSLAALNELPKSDFMSYITRTADARQYNPVTQYITTAPWDGNDYISQLFSCLILEEGEDPQVCYTLFRRWILGAVAVGLGITPSFESVLVLVDPEGGVGKTRFFEKLAPQGLFLNSHFLNVLDKDNIKTAISYWLVELGELDATFSKSDQARLKGFLSKRSDDLRMPYTRSYQNYPRHTAFFGTVNSESFLVDSSSNRRFWPIRVSGMIYEHNINMQQVWAQALRAIEAGERWYLTPEETKSMSERNEDFRGRTRVDDLLDKYIGKNNPSAPVLSVTEILEICGISSHTRAERYEAGRWLRKRGFKKYRSNGKTGYRVSPNEATNSIVSVTFSQLNQKGN